MRRSGVTIPSALLLLLLLGATSTSQPAATIDSLIAQLGSDDYRVRQAAADRLVEQGAGARPILQKLADDSSDVERRSLAAGILTRLDRVARIGPTYISLHARNADARDVLRDLASQAKIAMRFSDGALRAGRLPPVTIDVDRQPFWVAVGVLCGSTHTHLQQADLVKGIELVAGKEGNTLGRQVCASGPFVVAFKNVARREQATLPVVHVLGLELFMDPRAQPIEPPDVVIDRAIDQAGHSLLPKVNASRVNLFGVRGRMRAMVVTAIDLADDTHTIKKLHGTITATFAAESQTVTIADPATSLNKPRAVGPFTIEVKDFRCAETGGVYTLAFHRSSPGPLYLNGLQLVDNTGAVVSEMDGTLLMTSPSPYTMSAPIRGKPSIKLPVSLRWTVPMRAETVRETFELIDLPLQ